MTSTDGKEPQPAASPTASFFDMSDDEEGEYNTIMHSSSGRGVKLLFSKSKVCLVHFVAGCSTQADSGTTGVCSSNTLI